MTINLDKKDYSVRELNGEFYLRMFLADYYPLNLDYYHSKKIRFEIDGIVYYGKIASMCILFEGSNFVDIKIVFENVFNFDWREDGF